MLQLDVLFATQNWCWRKKGGVGALRESDYLNFLKPNGQSRNLNVYMAGILVNTKI